MGGSDNLFRLCRRFIGGLQSKIKKIFNISFGTLNGRVGQCINIKALAFGKLVVSKILNEF